MKILYVTSVYPRWKDDATPPFVQNQAKLMAAKGYTVRVVAPHAKGAVFSEEDEGVSVRRYSYMIPHKLEQLCYDGGMLIQLKARPWTWLLLPLFLVAQLMRVSLECRQWKPDVIHSHSLLPQGLVCILVARLFRIPHVCTSHGNDVFGLKPGGLMGGLKRHVLKHSSAVTVNSSATRDAVLALGAVPAKVHLIPAVANVGEVDSSIVDSIERKYGKSPKLLFVGRFIEEKGVMDLLTAFVQVKEQVVDAQCLFVGDGVLRADMEAMARDLKIERSVHFIGWQPGSKIASWMAAADVLIVPSKPVGTWQEAQGLVVVEAMSVGTPVIASRMGGIPDMIEEGKTGRLFTPRDSEGLTNVLVDLFKNPAESQRMAEAARNRIAEYHAPDAVAKQTEVLYQRCVKH